MRTALRYTTVSPTQASEEAVREQQLGVQSMFSKGSVMRLMTDKETGIMRYKCPDTT